MKLLTRAAEEHLTFFQLSSAVIAVPSLLQAAAWTHVSELVEVALLTAITLLGTTLKRDEVLLLPVKVVLRVEHSHLDQHLIRADLLITSVVHVQLTLHVGEAAVVACRVEVEVILHAVIVDVDDVARRLLVKQSIAHGLQRRREEHGALAVRPLYVDTWLAVVIEGVAAQLRRAELRQIGELVEARRLAVEVGCHLLTCEVEVVAAVGAMTGWHEAIEAVAAVARVYLAHLGALCQNLDGCNEARESHCVLV